MSAAEESTEISDLAVQYFSAMMDSDGKTHNTADRSPAREIRQELRWKRFGVDRTEVEEISAKIALHFWLHPESDDVINHRLKYNLNICIRQN